MTIAILSNTSWNIYNFRVGLIKALQAKGFRVVVISPEDEYTKKIMSLGVDFENVKINLKGQNPIQDFLLAKQYYSIFKRRNPAVVLTFTIKPNIYGNLAAKLLSTKVISNVTGLGTIFIKASFATFIASLLYKWSFSKCSLVFFQNMTDMRFFKIKKFIEGQQGDLIPGSGVDIDKFNLKERDVDIDRLKFLFVGRIIKDKGVVEYLEAATELKRFNSRLEFYIVGKTGYDNKTALTKQEFATYLDEDIVKHYEHTDDMLSIYKEMDIIVLPSYREGMSRTLLEAAAMKMPIITSNVPGCKEIVKEGKNGFLVKPKSKTDLVEKIKKIEALSKEDILKMGQESRKIVANNFSEAKVIEKYIRAIETLEVKHY